MLQSSIRINAERRLPATVEEDLQAATNSDNYRIPQVSHFIKMKKGLESLKAFSISIFQFTLVLVITKRNSD